VEFIVNAGAAELTRKTNVVKTETAARARLAKRRKGCLIMPASPEFS
jgi:hypothetical protein